MVAAVIRHIDRERAGKDFAVNVCDEGKIQVKIVQVVEPFRHLRKLQGEMPVADGCGGTTAGDDADVVRVDRAHGEAVAGPGD